MAMLRMLVWFERWDDILDGKTLPDGGGFSLFEVWRHYALGLAHLGKGNLTLAQSELEVLEREILRVRNDLPKQDNVPQRGVQIRNSLALAVAPLELKGRILAREGKADEAIALLHRALEQEQKIGYSEPPLYPHPMEEVLGQTLLNLGRWSEAETMFDAAIERDHGSRRALFGLMQALQREGKGTKARETYLQFVKAWARADSDLPEMRRAKDVASAQSQPTIRTRARAETQVSLHDTES
jgi:tetratricopeptide (TPR) repeat protein